MKRQNSNLGRSKNVINPFLQRDWDCNREILYYLINKETKHNQAIRDLGWRIDGDQTAALKELLLNYILKHFTLNELDLIFYSTRNLCFLNPFEIKTERRYVVQSINKNDSLTKEEVKRLKREVWDMNPILYGLLFDFLHKSGLFHNEEEVFSNNNPQHISKSKINKNMIESFSKSERKYLKHLIFAYENGIKIRLNSLMDIYNDYGRPEGKSPKEFINKPFIKEQVEMQLSIYFNEGVIEFDEQNILVNTFLFKLYMKEMDCTNYGNNDMYNKFREVDDAIRFLSEIISNEFMDKLDALPISQF
jgi:hypothetical protein